MKTSEKALSAISFYITGGSANDTPCANCDAQHLLVLVGALGIALATMIPRNPARAQNLAEFIACGTGATTGGLALMKRLRSLTRFSRRMVGRTADWSIMGDAYVFE